MKCQYCGENIDLLSKCPFCGGHFCPNHRLPENHACPELEMVRARKHPSAEDHYLVVAENRSEPFLVEPPVDYPPRFGRAGISSISEVLHLMVGALLVMAIGLSLRGPIHYQVLMIFVQPTITLGSAIIFTSIFVSHELAHKAVARHYGLWAEFRLSLMGVLFALMSLTSIPIKIIAPGAVIISGAADRKVIGKTAFAGPCASIVLSCLLLLLHYLTPIGPLASVFRDGATLSAWISFLNLLPFAVLDGTKIIWWSKSAWAIIFAASVMLVIFPLRNVLMFLL